MVQQLTVPQTEQEFRNLQDWLYKTTIDAINEGKSPSFKGIVEVASSKVVVTNAIHKIKANKGSKTAGVDGKTIRDILEKDLEEVYKVIEQMFLEYDPEMIRRVYIPKGNGKEGERPLGIPAIADRIVQECVRQTIEPIFEAQFFKHSYGFRPMRDTKHAIERIVFITNRIGYNWVVEGDIKGFFDNVNHTLLIKQMWHMGIKDSRLLMIIKAMLKAGIMNEIKVNPLGTPQGGIISPLLANIYLHKLDHWITREWEEKEMRNGTEIRTAKYASLRNHSSITRPEFYVRYADDWVLFTNTKINAEKWKYRIKEYLQSNLNLELSEDKSHITDITKKPIKFLGFKVKMLPKGKNNKLVGYVRPDEDKIDFKIQEIRKDLKRLKDCTDNDWLVNDINVINSKIRGIINYYNSAPGVNECMRKWKETLKYASYKAIKKYGGKWKPANLCVNLKSVHGDRTEQIPAIQYNGQWIGITSSGMATWKKKPMKNQEETPYTPFGRELFEKRTKKRPLLARAEELMELSYSRIIAGGKKNPIYNFEYYMNRCYAFNRDKGRCKVCNEWLDAKNTTTHHIYNNLPMEEINKVQNLASLCESCHVLVHKPNLDVSEIERFDKKSIDRLNKYRSIILVN